MVGDNESCLTVLDTGFPNASRHLRLRFDVLQEAIKAGHMVLVQVPSEEQLADGLTKALGSVKHAAFLQVLGLH
jgi:BarA-like signal transduction histidine kinase